MGMYGFCISSIDTDTYYLYIHIVCICIRYFNIL